MIFDTKLLWVLVLLVGVSCSSDDQETGDLEQQFNALVALSESETCVDADDWSFAGIGSKPCGGPTGYIAYAKSIDTVDFLDKLKKYNEAVRDYNIANDLASDCLYVSPPGEVVCEDGKAILIYD